MSTQDNFDHLSDTDILELAGPYGPGIIGQALFDRAQSIRSRGDDGKLGPALLDSDFAAKQAAKRAAAAPPTDPTAPPPAPPAPGSWDDITVSGLKLLAQEHGVSYKPRVARAELLEALIAAGVTPPPAPTE
jgi:hypothetical protein